jgi:hypothetical protein
MTRIRLHTRSIIRDGSDVFIGSQSLRALELDGRREVGVILHDRRLAARISKVFEDDWSQTAEPKEEAAPVEKVAKKMAKAVTKQLPPLVPVLEGIIKEMGHTEAEVELVRDEVEDTMKGAVKEAIKEAVKDVLESEIEQAPLAHSEV